VASQSFDTKLPPRLADELLGAGRLATDAVVGVTDVVEAMHAAIAYLAPAIGRPAPAKTIGLTGFVYDSVRSIARLVGAGADVSLSALAPLLGSPTRSPTREAVVAVLNGVFGDHLHATNNPLAIAMQIRQAGDALPLASADLARSVSHPGGRLLVLVHGLCMNDLQWSSDGHDHGRKLARELGFSVVHLHYNTGRRIIDNGRMFAELLEKFIGAWPVPVEELVFLCHSMGGLVVRSAIDSGLEAGNAWSTRPLRVVFLGTPHHGAPLERAGGWIERLMGLSPYSAPIAKVGGARSAGIRDLRHGLMREDGGPMPLPAHVRAYAIAASINGSRGPRSGAQGDGLVPVASALGEHPNRAFDLRIPKADRWIAHGIHHFDLLHSAAVYRRINDWLDDAKKRPA
jgi:hypothetical protein